MFTLQIVGCLILKNRDYVPEVLERIYCTSRPLSAKDILRNCMVKKSYNVLYYIYLIFSHDFSCFNRLWVWFWSHIHIMQRKNSQWWALLLYSIL
jgi:hypothetical protein